MKIFSCDQCGQPVFFENVQCLHCGSRLAFLPDTLSLAALRPADLPQGDAVASPDGNAQPLQDTADAPAIAPAAGLWQHINAPAPAPGESPRTYKLCYNHVQYQACNFAVPSDDPNGLCISCRQTRLLPDLSVPDNHERWYRIENAKRRLYYTLAQLGLTSKGLDDPNLPAPTYDFLADVPGAAPVMTGHQNGVITLNIAEADDDERVKRRVQLHEPYRTLLGHLRHESGHFYWDQLIRDGGRTAAFREVFGDESLDYGEALKAHYAASQNADGPSWRDQFVSAYARSHPWEDWAETWAHYLHMVDLLETAASYQTSLVIPGTRARALGPDDPFEQKESDFDTWIQQWVPVTLLLNSLNRSLGQDDAYPFALSEGALRKLRYVHDVIREATHKAPSEPNGMQDAPIENSGPQGEPMHDAPADALADAPAMTPADAPLN